MTQPTEPQIESAHVPMLEARRGPCAVKLPTFEGPLDLLLHLIRAHEIDIHDIPIALISEQYLAYLDLMRELDIDVASDYLLMAATLAQIKSRLLLPSTDALDDEEGGDPREELARRLAEFAAFREAAAELERRPRLGRDVFEAEPDRSTIGEREAVLQVSLFAMLEALQSVLARLPAQERHHQVRVDRLTLQERMVAIMDALNADSGGSMLFETVLQDGATTRHRVVMTFLAILELARIQALRIFQSSDGQGRPHGPIRLILAVPEGTSAAARTEADV
ncbi:MAG: segregation and condensation protein A [Myxococcota bacterium]